ncbi:UNVERIFIED_CONTAM: hypothetical protein GTU68_009086 [Idotea baltica]|nr:hypothetical protein [Idotea baltica]
MAKVAVLMKSSTWMADASNPSSTETFTSTQLLNRRQFISLLLISLTPKLTITSYLFVLQKLLKDRNQLLFLLHSRKR